MCSNILVVLTSLLIIASQIDTNFMYICICTDKYQFWYNLQLSLISYMNLLLNYHMYSRCVKDHTIRLLFF